MRKIMFAVAAVVTMAVFTGCASVEVTPAAKLSKRNIAYSGSPVAHLHANIWGIYFFHIPIITPSIDAPGKLELLQNTITTENCIRVLTAESKKLKATKTLNMVTTTSTAARFFGIREVSISANAVR